MEHAQVGVQKTIFVRLISVALANLTKYMALVNSRQNLAERKLIMGAIFASTPPAYYELVNTGMSFSVTFHNKSN